METRLRRPPALTRLLLVLAALLALGQLQGGAAGAATTAHDLVAGPVSTSTASPARLVRHLPNPAPWSHLHLAVWAGTAMVLLLPSLGGAASSATRRTRPAYLLPFAGRGPPVTS